MCEMNSCLTCVHSYFESGKSKCDIGKMSYPVLSGAIYCDWHQVKTIVQTDGTTQKKLSDKSDNVNHPAHYETGKFECFDVMIETQGKEAVLNFCVCNAFKYIYRFRNKGGDEDIKKANWYLSKYLELRESE